MDLDNRLKKLNELPVEPGVKQNMYRRMHEKDAYRPPIWKEIFLVGAITVIAVFLSIIPSIAPPQQQTADQTVEAIYAYKDGEEGKFYARPSTLYLGVEKVENPTAFTLFEEYRSLVTPSVGHLEPYPIDVSVIRDGKEERWQLSANGMLKVDSGIFFEAKDRNSFYEEFYSIYRGLRQYPNHLSIVFLFAAILTNTFPSIVYKRRKKKEKSPLQSNLWFGLLTVISFGVYMYWQFNIGPIYTPILIPFFTFLIVAVHFFLKFLSAPPFVYRIEIIRYVVLSLLFITFTYSI